MHFTFSLEIFVFLTVPLFCRSTKDDYGHMREAEAVWATRDKCRQLPYPQCQCNDTHVACINAQQTQTDVFLHVHNYPYVVDVTFRGNNFLDLPAHVLGAREYEQLRYLNLSANYFVNIDPAAFAGMPNLVRLDLSHNEMLFDKHDVDLFTPLPKLESLYLRKAFPRPMHNATEQMGIFHGMLKKAKLNKLRLLDLGYNELEQIPEKLGCAIPNLEILLLAGNSFRTFHVDINCYQRLKKLDLSDNFLARLDQRFMSFCDSMPRNALSLQRNPFECENHYEYINWLRSAACVQDREVIKCQPGTDDGYLIRVSDRHLASGPGDPLNSVGSSGDSFPQSVSTRCFTSAVFAAVYCAIVFP